MAVLQRWQARPGEKIPPLLPGAKPPGGEEDSEGEALRILLRTFAINVFCSLLVYSNKLWNVSKFVENTPALLYLIGGNLKNGPLENNLPD